MNGPTDTETELPPEPTQADPGTPGPRRGRQRLTRRLDTKLVAGVASGLGEHFDVDPVLFRIGFVVLALAGGVGVLIYLLLWWVVPPSYGPSGLGVPGRPAGHRVIDGIRGGRAWFGIVLAVLGIAIALDALTNSFGFFRPGLIWGTALVLLGILIYQRTTGGTPFSVPPPPQDGESAPLTREPAPVPPPSSEPATWTAPPAAPSPPPKVRRERSPLGWLTFGIALLCIGVAATLDQAGVLTLTPVRYLALALTILGLGLLVGARWGRARWLVVPGLMLVPFVLAASLIDVPWQGGFGQRLYQPVVATDLHSPYRLAAGDLRLDLSTLSFDALPASVTASVGAGNIYVIVPSTMHLLLREHAGAGEVRVESDPFDPSDTSASGVGASLERDYGGTTVAGTLSLDLRVGFGQVLVFRESPQAAAGV